MKRNEQLTFYSDCWHELKRFLYGVLNDLPDEVKISIFFKINLLTKFQKSVSYKVITNGRFVNE